MKLHELMPQPAEYSFESPDPIRIVGITTRNRPEALKECLKNLADHLTVYPRECEVIVTDDSDDHATALLSLASARVNPQMQVLMAKRFSD